MDADPFSQHPYRCRLEWGRRGAQMAAERGDILIIVDTLSFSTAIVTAVHYGGIVCPCSPSDDATSIARRIGGEAAVQRQDVPHKGRFSLSPLTYLGLAAGTRIVLASPNGGVCSQYGRTAPHLFIGTLVNAQAAAAAVSALLDSSPGLCATLIACGERWPRSDIGGEVRVAVEDYLGAGAVLSHLPQEKSPEARVCEGAFRSVQGNLREILWECGSGRELRAKGWAADVEHAAQLNVYAAVPVLRGECFESLKSTSSQTSR